VESVNVSDQPTRYKIAVAVILLFAHPFVLSHSRGVFRSMDLERNGTFSEIRAT